MKYLLFFFTLIIIASCSTNNDGAINSKTVSSPDGNIKFTISIENGKPFYQVFYGEKELVKKSGFSFEFRGQKPFETDLNISEIKESSVDEKWTPVCGTFSTIRNHYKEAVITLKENIENGRSIDFIVRVYDDGIGFRYGFPEESWKDSILITAEKTKFELNKGDSAWWIPSDEFAYESLYRHNALNEISDANTPMTIETSNGMFLSIHEAALLDYSEMVLRKDSTRINAFVSSLWPWPDGVCSRVKAPFKTPWRCILISERAGGLIESNLVRNLNEPCKIKDVSWIKPMKFVGIWWGMHLGKYTWYAGPNHGATTERAKKYIDFAAKHKIEGFLAEGWNLGWETWASGVKPVQDFCTPYPDFDLKEVVKYGKEKGVEFISHHETGGNIPEYEKQLDSAMALCQKLGIISLKTGYAGPIIPTGQHHHGQYMVRHFQKVVETAAKYHVAINPHESIKPTGLDRTWPNLLSQEAARGNEWNGTYKATPPYHSTILPFTRFLAGPYDYTPGIFKINHSPEKNKRLYCTFSHELALFVVFYSPVMMAADMIENYEGHPAMKFVEELPPVWDETKVIDAKLGDFVTIARRKGNRWFVGTVSDENCHLVKIPLSFLEKGKSYHVTIFGDSEQTDWQTNPEIFEEIHLETTSKDTIYAACAKAGGHAMIIEPLENKVSIKMNSLKDYNSGIKNKMVIYKMQKTYGDMKVSHQATGKDITLSYPFNSKYPASGKNALTDGIRGDYNYSSGSWQGYEGTDMEAVIDLQKNTQIKEISAGFLNSPNDWIFYPEKVEFFTSTDGKNFKKSGEENYSTKNPGKEIIIELKDFKCNISAEARYVKIKAIGVKICPPWHYGKGNKCWMFCDEVVVR